MRNSNAWRTTSSRLALLASSSVFGLTAVAGGPMARADEPGLPPPKTYAVSGLRGPVDYSFQGTGGGNGVYISPNGGNAGYGPQLTVNFDGAGIFGQIAAPTVSIASQGGNGGSGYTFEVANPGGNGGHGGGGGDITVTLDSLTSVISSSTDIGAAFTVSSPGGSRRSKRRRVRRQRGGQSRQRRQRRPDRSDLGERSRNQERSRACRRQSRRSGSVPVQWRWRRRRLRLLGGRKQGQWRYRRQWWNDCAAIERQHLLQWLRNRGERPRR